MSAEPQSGAEDRTEFLVRPDGTVVGDDGVAGALAAALPYTGRLARRMGELVEAGDLRVMEASGTHRLTVGVTWTPAGEGTFRAAVTSLVPRSVPVFTVVGAVDTTAAVAHCLDRLSGVDGVVWSSVVTAGSRVIAAVGDRRELHHLAEVGNRMLAILRSLEDQHATGFVRLRFERGAVIGASLGRHALVAYTTVTNDDEVLAVIDEIRAVLAGHDLSAVATELDPDTDPDTVEAPATPVPDGAHRLDPRPAPDLVGARFRGAGEPVEKRRRRSIFRGR